LVRRGLIGLAAAALIGVGTASAVGAEEAVGPSSYANNETGVVHVAPVVPGYYSTAIAVNGEPAVIIHESIIDEPAGDDVVVEFI
jgi:hypothetical protein